MSILKLRGYQGKTIYEIDTNRVKALKQTPQGETIVTLNSGKIILLDNNEYWKLYNALNADR